MVPETMRESRFPALACSISGPTWTSVNWKGREYPHLRNGITIFTTISLLFLIESSLAVCWAFRRMSFQLCPICCCEAICQCNELRRNSTVNNLHFSHLSLFFNNVAVMLRWGRRYRHVSDALVVLSMIMNGTWSASRSACCKLGLILFPFLLVARLCCLSLDHLHVGYHSDTKDILSPPGPPPSWICWN